MRRVTAAAFFGLEPYPEREEVVVSAPGLRERARQAWLEQQRVETEIERQLEHDRRVQATAELLTALRTRLGLRIEAEAVAFDDLGDASWTESGLRFRIEPEIRLVVAAVCERCGEPIAFVEVGPFDAWARIGACLEDRLFNDCLCCAPEAS